MKRSDQRGSPLAGYEDASNTSAASRGIRHRVGTPIAGAVMDVVVSGRARALQTYQLAGNLFRPKTNVCRQSGRIDVVKA